MISGNDLSVQILSNITTWMKYAKHLPLQSRRECWDEVVDRNLNMHLNKFPFLAPEIQRAYQFVRSRKILPSMRSMQFAGRPIELNPARVYNCSYMPMDDPAAFQEVMFLLLSGVGVGYSVQRDHVEQLPPITTSLKTRRFVVGDSVEGWADAVKILIESYFYGKPRPRFDFSDIRPKGARLVTAGGKAPGPEPLKDCLHNIQKILDRKTHGECLTTLDVHDINCYIADAVLAGGIRRSAMIALFNLDDERMLTCKTGNWQETNPQRQRANNSAVVQRHRIDKYNFLKLWNLISKSFSGEPGFFMTNNTDWGLNPCAEISLRPWTFCNLTTINASNIEDQQDFNERADAAAFLGTLQASYTDFHYLRDIWKTSTEKDALIGVSMTGIASGAIDSLDTREAAMRVVTENERVANLLGIRKAARCTTVKPEGTSSLVLGTSSGIHAWHNDYYIRRLRIGKNEAIYDHLHSFHPELLEDDFFDPSQKAMVVVPQKAPNGAILRTEGALELLSRVNKIWNEWVLPGHRKGENVNNVSATIPVKSGEWGDVGEWMWKNQEHYTALSVFPYDDHEYVQPPFEDITKEKYDELMQSLTNVDLSNVYEPDDETSFRDSVACSGGQCELR